MNIQKIQAILGIDTCAELDGADEEQLKQSIYMASAAMQEVEQELEANARYQEIKLQKAALELGKRDVDKRQKAKIKYCLHLIDERGKR